MLNMFRMIIHPSSGACELFVELFHGLYCSGSMCVGVTLWFGCGGVVSGCGLRHFYVYWTLHHLDIWIKRDQLNVTWFIISLLNAQHVSDVNTSILRSLRLMCWVISWVVLLWFNVCWSYVVVWLWWCGIRRASTCIWIPHHHSHTTTHIKPDQCNPRNNSTHKWQAPEDGCINIRNMLTMFHVI